MTNSIPTKPITDNPAVHPQCRILSAVRVYKHAMKLYAAGDHYGADESHCALNRALLTNQNPALN